jgi:hypothetical protein
MACTLLAAVGTAAAADDAAKESMEMRQKMLDDCVAKQDAAADKHTAMKACIDMLDKQMAGKEMGGKHEPGTHVYDESAPNHSMPHGERMPHAGAQHDDPMPQAGMPHAVPHEEAGKEAIGK